MCTRRSSSAPGTRLSVSLLWNGTYCCRQQGLKAFGGGLNGCKLRMRVQHLCMNKYIPLVSCVSNLFKSWHCLLKSQSLHWYLLSTYSCGIRVLSAMGYGVRVVRTTLSALFQSTITGAVVWGFRSSSVAVAHEGYLVESADLSGSDPHKLIALSLIHWALPVGGSVTQHVNKLTSFRLASCTSLSSPFSSPCYVGSHCSAFLSC